MFDCWLFLQYQDKPLKAAVKMSLPQPSIPPSAPSSAVSAASAVAAGPDRSKRSAVKEDEAMVRATSTDMCYCWGTEQFNSQSDIIVVCLRC
jgi:hypothetical protein